MHPILLKVNSMNVYSYGFMVAVGFGLATFLMYRRSEKFGLNKDRVLDLAILVLVAGIIGARLLYVLLNLKSYLADPSEIFKLANGGLIWYGGFIAALIAAVIYIRKNRMGFWTVADFLVPYLALAQCFGRIGCFLNGCCYGLEINGSFPFSVLFPGDACERQPVQIYAALALLLIYVILRFRQERPHFNGEIFLAYCILYPLKRFVIEFFRGDNQRAFLGLTLSQVISAVVFSVSLFIFLRKSSEWKKKNISLT